MFVQREGDVPHEREYIAREVRSLVRKNRDVKSQETVAKKLQEFESRIETGVHYKIPYPRPINVVPGATGKDPVVVTPVYLHSYGSVGSSAASRRKGQRAPVYDE